VTSNQQVRDWVEIFAGDESLTTAILARLVDQVHIVDAEGRSYRLREPDGPLKVQAVPRQPAPKKERKLLRP
jgi:DNA replication protein DnaC